MSYSAVCARGELCRNRIVPAGRGTIYSSPSAAQAAIDHYAGIEQWSIVKASAWDTRAAKAMTPAQFATLTRLAGSQDSPSHEAARLVLVDGLRPSVAARECGVTRTNLGNRLKRLRDVEQLARSFAASD